MGDVQVFNAVWVSCDLPKLASTKSSGREDDDGARNETSGRKCKRHSQMVQQTNEEAGIAFLRVKIQVMEDIQQLQLSAKSYFKQKTVFSAAKLHSWMVFVKVKAK